jgi:hypothetical protein
MVDTGGLGAEMAAVHTFRFLPWIYTTGAVGHIPETSFLRLMQI